MKFDTIIIGGGLSGLVCGIQLAKQGQRCVIISSGQSALHFSSGSFDLLNALPDGTEVVQPLEGVKRLVEQVPCHPYAKLGNEKFEMLARKAKELLVESGVVVNGDEKKNHYRISPMGTMHPTWLTLADHPDCLEEGRLPWKKIAIFNIVGFLDFYTQFIADEFRKIGTESEIHLVNFDALEYLRKNPSEMRSANIARMFDKQENLKELAELLKQKTNDCEAIVLPAIVGLNRTDGLEYLKQAISKPVVLLPTLPPSVPGIRTQQRLRKCFQDTGGVYMLGDTVVRAEKEGNRITKVYSYNHGDIPFVANNVVLATGSYFSQGLIATQDQVYEPIFGLDISFMKEREQWYDLNLFNKQEYQSFGVKTDRCFHGICQGQPLENLFVAGAILEGFNPVKEGCGAGVSVLSALNVAEQILKQ